jgi:hypothetical protein
MFTADLTRLLWLHRLLCHDLDCRGDVQVQRYPAQADRSEGSLCFFLGCNFTTSMCVATELSGRCFIILDVINFLLVNSFPLWDSCFIDCQCSA